MAHLFSLTAEQQEISNVAKKFAATEIAPHALEWDQARHLPLDVIRSTASLGMGGESHR